MISCAGAAVAVETGRKKWALFIAGRSALSRDKKVLVSKVQVQVVVDDCKMQHLVFCV